MEEKELNKRVELHKLSIDTEGKEGERLKLTGADLRYAKLRYAGLSGADLTDAILTGAILTDANFR